MRAMPTITEKGFSQSKGPPANCRPETLIPVRRPPRVSPWLTHATRLPRKNARSHILFLSPLVPEFEGDAAEYETQDERHQGKVEGAGKHRVDHGESGENGPAAEEEPCLVGVPDRSDGRQEGGSGPSRR